MKRVDKLKVLLTYVSIHSLMLVKVRYSPKTKKKIRDYNKLIYRQKLRKRCKKL